MSTVKNKTVAADKAPQTNNENVKTVQKAGAVKQDEVLPEVEPIIHEVRRQGRPVDPNSDRQKRLAKYEEKQKEGTLRRGRPVETESERQKRLAAYEQKKAEGIELKRGRPVDPESERQQRILNQQMKTKENKGIRKGVPVIVNHPKLKGVKDLEVVKLSGTEVTVKSAGDVTKWQVPVDIVEINQKALEEKQLQSA